jgi:hypothetical protein
VICQTPDCGNVAETGKEECFRCRISSVGFGFRGSAIVGRRGFHKTANEWRQENFGTTSEKELAARGIERAPS